MPNFSNVFPLKPITSKKKQISLTLSYVDEVKKGAISLEIINLGNPKEFAIIVTILSRNEAELSSYEANFANSASLTSLTDY